MAEQRVMRGPGGEFEMPFDGVVFGGPARSESRNYWIKREGAVEVIVPGIDASTHCVREVLGCVTVLFGVFYFWLAGRMIEQTRLDRSA